MQHLSAFNMHLWLHLGSNQPNIHPLKWCQDNSGSIPLHPPLHPTPLLNSLKILTHPRNSIHHLCYRKVLSKRDPWSTIKWDITPGSRCPCIPSFGIEVIDCRTEKIFTMLHYEGRVKARSIFRDGNWLELDEKERGVRRGRKVHLHRGG